nr:MAG TPA: hypothetical protein [Caudoviricetes sp.]
MYLILYNSKIDFRHSMYMYHIMYITEGCI